MPKIEEMPVVAEAAAAASSAAVIEAPEVENAVPRINFDFLLKPTGPGGLEEYIEHPLNFQKSKALAQVLRGLTGMLGDIKLAVIDIAMGVLNYTKERAANAINRVS